MRDPAADAPRHMTKTWFGLRLDSCRQHSMLAEQQATTYTRTTTTHSALTTLSSLDLLLFTLTAEAAAALSASPRRPNPEHLQEHERTTPPTCRGAALRRMVWTGTRYG